MGIYEDRAKLAWCLTTQAGGTTISANGNSGTWGDTAPASFPSSPVNLEIGSDFQLMVYATGKTSTPTFSVGLGYYDNLGNLFAPTALLLSSISLTGLPGTPVAVTLNAGVRAGSGGSTYYAFPSYGQVYWTCSGGTVTGVNISLWAK